MLGILQDTVLKGARIMVFADCENIVLRTLLSERAKQLEWVSDDKFFSWSPVINRVLSQWGRLVRVWGYTSVYGGADAIEITRENMKRSGITAPQVYSKPKGRHRKQVDIALATEATRQAHLNNFDVAVFVTGDGDFAPVFRCLKDMGKGVVLFTPPTGVSPSLIQESDESYDLSVLLTEEFREVEILSSRQTLEGQTFQIDSRATLEPTCDVPLLIRRSTDSSPGRRSIALTVRAEEGVRRVVLIGSNLRETLTERQKEGEDEINCGAQLLELLPELEFSGLRLVVTLFPSVSSGDKFQIELSAHSESSTDRYKFSVVVD